jgi:hypothetical protein
LGIEKRLPKPEIGRGHRRRAFRIADLKDRRLQRSQMSQENEAEAGLLFEAGPWSRSREKLDVDLLYVAFLGMSFPLLWVGSVGTRKSLDVTEEPQRRELLEKLEGFDSNKRILDMYCRDKQASQPPSEACRPWLGT